MAYGSSKSVKHFVLIHGACLGAWCWYKLVNLLHEAGHKVTALDLGAAGRNQVPLKDLRTIDDYHKPLYSFLEGLSLEDKIIIVGHSMGGYAISSALERFPEKIAYGVFASAYMLGPNLTPEKLAQRFDPGSNFYLDSEQKSVGEGDDTQTVILFGHEFLTKKVYQNSPSEDLKLATLAARPTKFFSDDESNKQLLTTKEKYGSVRRAYFIGTSDQAIPADVQRWMIEQNPPDVVKEIEGADHMVMISKVQELCTNLLEICSNI